MWASLRIDDLQTRRALEDFARQVLTQAREDRWHEVRSVSSRDALEALGRLQAPQLPLSELLARPLRAGTWIVWIQPRGGHELRLEIDDLSWRPLRSPWRKRHFRLVRLERAR